MIFYISKYEFEKIMISLEYFTTYYVDSKIIFKVGDTSYVFSVFNKCTAFGSLKKYILFPTFCYINALPLDLPKESVQPKNI